MQQFQVLQRTRMATVLFITALLFLPSAQAASGGASVSGMVRDLRGVAQMGALVQVLTADSATAGTTFTDAQGRYSISNLNPGRYLVRASQSLYVPATRTNLQLSTGATAVVNLTLAALFDSASWLPAERRRADESEDEWKWTLRSAANRPILRMVDEGDDSSSSDVEVPTQRRSRTEVKETLASSSGSFGQGGYHTVIAIHHSFDGQGDLTARADLAASGGGGAEEFNTGFERILTPDSGVRTVLSYQSQPQLVATGGAQGLQVFSLTSGRRMSFGDAILVELGANLQAVHAGEEAVTSHPFVRIMAHPTGVWTLHYRMATDRGVQGFEDVTIGRGELPVAVVQDGKLQLASGNHQEFGLARHTGRGTVEVAVYHDVQTRTEVAGLISGGAASASQLAAAEGVVVDRATGAVRMLAGGYTSTGARFTVGAPLSKGMWIAAEYSTGDALAAPGHDGKGAAGGRGLDARAAQSAAVVLKGRLTSSGTRVIASYRWQPESTVTAVDPYSAFSDRAYLGCMLRQPIRMGRFFVHGLDATIDVTNLLAEGYRPFVSEDGQTLVFAQAPRSLQAGLSFTF